MFRHLLKHAASVCVLMCLPSPALAGPGLIQYQGRLTNSAGNPVTTPVSVTFTFWSAATGGSQLGGGYYDTDTVTPDANGIYATMIGDETGSKVPDSIFTSPQVWLNVAVGGENLSPRKQMVATGYAFQSNWATTATTALTAKSAPEADTLATVTGRGASTTKELTFSGGAKAGKISPLTVGGSVQVENVYMVGGSVALPAITPPASPANKIYYTSGTLYWNGARVMLACGESYVVVHTESDPLANGRNLKAAYAFAKAMRPNGHDLSTSNRLAVLVPPGNYDLTSNSLVLDTEFIDLAGLSTIRADQHIYGYWKIASTYTVRQSANDVRVENINFEAICPTYFGVPPVAYASDSGTTKTMLRNCEFTGTGQAASMSSQKDFPGYYENCKANNSAFGYSGEASGTFVNCTAGNCSFGYYRKASGTFTNCIGGTYCFGAYGTASGTFTNCTGDSYSFGTASYSGTSYASGTFTNCVAGDYSFGARGYGSLSSSHVTGTFVNCAAGSESFGGYWGDTTDGHFIGCRMTGATWSGMFNGHMENCRWSAGFSCNPGARIYNSTILGAINMNNVACGVTQSRCKALSNFGNNLFGATASAAMITVNSNVQ